MGVDIHMSIISKEGEYRAKEIYDGRDTEWFDNISGDYRSEFYEHFPMCRGIPEHVPDEIRRDYNDNSNFSYYDFCYVNVGEFLDWFEHTRPDIDAGWVSTYDKWLYETKGIVPDLLHYLEEDANPYDYHFIEVVNPWDSSAWLYNFIKNQSNATPEDYIVYYFDCRKLTFS